jgi:hypothetical protein
MLSLASPARAGVEGRIETTSFPKIFALEVTLGLDAARSTNGYLLERTVKWLEFEEILSSILLGFSHLPFIK